MPDPSASPRALVEWGIATATAPGEAESGDQSLVAPYAAGVLMAVADGLGHGPDAAEAARRVIAALRAHAGESVIGLLRHAHVAALGTRGCVLSMAVLERADHTMTWIGVGNVAGVLLRAGSDAHPPVEYLLPRAGVVGFTLPTLRAVMMPLAAGDTLILATDGVRPDFVPARVGPEQPQRLAELLLARHRQGVDDALVLVARVVGEGP